MNVRKISGVEFIFRLLDRKSGHQNLVTACDKLRAKTWSPGSGSKYNDEHDFDDYDLPGRSHLTALVGRDATGEEQVWATCRLIPGITAQTASLLEKTLNVPQGQLVEISRYICNVPMMREVGVDCRTLIQFYSEEIDRFAAKKGWTDSISTVHHRLCPKIEDTRVALVTILKENIQIHGHRFNLVQYTRKNMEQRRAA